MIKAKEGSMCGHWHRAMSGADAEECASRRGDFQAQMPSLSIKHGRFWCPTVTAEHGSCNSRAHSEECDCVAGGVLVDAEAHPRAIRQGAGKLRDGRSCGVGAIWSTVIVTFSLLLLIECSAGFLAQSPRMFATKGLGTPILREAPEYTCVYDDCSTAFQEHLAAACRNIYMENIQLRSRSGSSDQDATMALGGNHPQHHNHWHSDMIGRYKELIPPNLAHPRNLHSSKKKCATIPSRVLSAEDLQKAVEALSASTSQSWLADDTSTGGKNRVEEAVMVLDLDKCSFWGSDGNDLGIALQWMEKSPDLVHQLYSLLLNPQVKATYARLQERAVKVRVVIYTMRATFLVYHSCFRDQTVMLRWNQDWHHGAQLFIPPSVGAEEVIRSYSLRAPLLEEERRDLKKSFERLFATRAVIAKELGLNVLPEIIVTSSPKDVQGAMRILHLPVENAYLWDDNSKLSDHPRVVQVPRFDALPQDQHDALVDFLNVHCPADALEDDLVDFMLGADPADVVLLHDRLTGRLHYTIPSCARLDEWALPCLVRTAKYEDRAAKALSTSLESERVAKRNRCSSPVTPEHELGV